MRYIEIVNDGPRLGAKQGRRTEMTNHPNRNSRFYAAQSPRGFANEINVHVFPSRDARDTWVAEHADDGDVNSASCGAYKITAKSARSILGYRGDAATQNYNSAIEH